MLVKKVKARLCPSPLFSLHPLTRISFNRVSRRSKSASAIIEPRYSLDIIIIDKNPAAAETAREMTDRSSSPFPSLSFCFFSSFSRQAQQKCKWKRSRRAGLCCTLSTLFAPLPVRSFARRLLLTIPPPHRRRRLFPRACPFYSPDRPPPRLPSPPSPPLLAPRLHAHMQREPDRPAGIQSPLAPCISESVSQSVIESVSR